MRLCFVLYREIDHENVKIPVRNVFLLFDQIVYIRQIDGQPTISSGAVRMDYLPVMLAEQQWW